MRTTAAVADPTLDADLVDLCELRVDGISLSTDVGAGRGRGYVATQALAPGQRVMEAVPFTVVLPAATTDIDSAVAPLTHTLLANPSTRATVLEILSYRQDLADQYRRTMQPSAELFSTLGVDEQQWFRAASAVRTNFWSDPDPITGEIRVVSLNIFASFFNHSCLPNASFDACPGTTASRPDHVTMIDAAAPGEEVTFSYPGLSLLLRPPSMRRATLLDVWGFVCTCVRCTGARAVEEEAALASDVPEAFYHALQRILGTTRIIDEDDARLAGTVYLLGSTWAAREGDWRANLMRRTLLSTKFPPEGRTYVALRLGWLSFLAHCARVFGRYLSKLSVFKERLYNEAMAICGYYGYTQRQVWETLSQADGVYALAAFEAAYHPTVMPSEISATI